MYNALKAGAIPVYLGADNIDDYLPSPKSIINARDFSSGVALAHYIQQVAANETLFRSYHAWSQQDVDSLLERRGCLHSSYCRFCEYAAKFRRQRNV